LEISNFGWNILKGHGRPQFAGGIAKNPKNHGSRLEDSGVVFQDGLKSVPRPFQYEGQISETAKDALIARSLEVT